MIVCSRCWKLNCECISRYGVEIDDSIADIIITINKKGYRTHYCCGGHGRALDELYINFNKWYCPEIIVSDIGKFWKYTKSDATIRVKLPKEFRSKSKEEIEEFLVERRKELIKRFGSAKRIKEASLEELKEILKPYVYSLLTASVHIEILKLVIKKVG